MTEYCNGIHCDIDELENFKTADGPNVGALEVDYVSEDGVLTLCDEDGDRIVVDPCPIRERACTLDAGLVADGNDGAPGVIDRPPLEPYTETDEDAEITDVDPDLDKDAQIAKIADALIEYACSRWRVGAGNIAFAGRTARTLSAYGKALRDRGYGIGVEDIIREGTAADNEADHRRRGIVMSSALLSEIVETGGFDDNPLAHLQLQGVEQLTARLVQLEG